MKTMHDELHELREVNNFWKCALCSLDDDLWWLMKFRFKEDLLNANKEVIQFWDHMMFVARNYPDIPLSDL